MSNRNWHIKWIAGAAVAGLFTGAGTELSAQSSAKWDSTKTLASDGQDARRAKPRPKRPSPKKPELPDVAKDPPPSAGPVPIPYPNTIK